MQSSERPSPDLQPLAAPRQGEPPQEKPSSDRGHESGAQVLERAYRELESELPDRLARLIRRLRSPDLRWLRIGIGVLCIAAAALWFLPVLGLEFLPIGLLLLAQDIPFLRRPLGIAMLWGVERWRSLRRWWKARRKRLAH